MGVNDVTNAANSREDLGTVRGISSRSRKPERSDKASQKPQGDSVAISPAAKEKSKIAKYVDIVNKMPDVREEEVSRVKDNVEKGLYSSRQILKKTAEKMLDE